MKLELNNSLENFLEKYPKTVMLNFSEEILNKNSDIESILIGCEGGFTNEEIKMFDSTHIIGLDTPMILKSESAVSAVTTKILL